MYAVDSVPRALGNTSKEPRSAAPWSLTDNCAILLLLVLFAGMALIIKPLGNFPLNDDWAYILPVEWLIKQGQLRFTDWQFMTLIGQVYLGAATAAVFGFSIGGLRLMVISLAALSIVLIYVIARLAQAPRQWALAAAGILLCNPIFLITSASFMTDTPFLTFCLISILFFLLWQIKSNTYFGFLAWFFVFYACSIRQSGIALAVGFTCFLALRTGFRRDFWLLAVLPTSFLVVCLAAYPAVIDRWVGLPSMYSQPTQEATAFVAGVFNLKLGYLLMAAKVALTACFYLALCTAPLLPIILSVERRLQRPPFWSNALPAIIFACLVTAALAATGHAAPVEGNTLFDFGLGVRTMQNEGPVKTAPTQVWWAIVFLGALSSFGLIRAALFMLADARGSGLLERRQDFRSAYAAMLVAILIIYNLPFLTRGGIWFDRYALPIVALFGLLAAPFIGQRPASAARWAISWFLMGASLVFSVLGTHDYLEWNTRRWEAAAELSRTYAADFAEIDAGFEYNNYRPRQLGDHRRATDKVLLTNPLAKYRIAFSPLPQHTVMKVIECRTWLYGSPSAIFMLRAD